MDSGHGKRRMNVEGDRISDLPDDLIHKILSFIDIRDAIGTSVLSSRWRFIWTSKPYLNFSSENFDKLSKFSEFVTHVLSRRNNLSEEIMAQKLLPELGVLLELEKNIIKINRARLELGEAQVENYKQNAKMNPKFYGNMAQIKDVWANLDLQLQRRKEQASLIMSKLQLIESLLTKLPASNRAKIQLYFSSMCVEADIVISQIADCMRIECDLNQILSSVCFHVLATTLEPSS
ncbi:hypothetical protein L1987_72332 [Smallanthus sonchifolius]|uniref:Uncharacterized protein n=1 Tax=Smallanthus sonchifolius TaxID=185202 RepID=A0ACB9AVL1_9ASTR|nr:hypothetical protein L1987_72332 [Smallanthus sonchifolius]